LGRNKISASGTIDVDRARRETPGCQHVLHFNNAGAALMPEPVTRAVQDYFDVETKIGGYEAHRMRADELEGIYATVARLIHCQPDEVAIVENATRAWDMAFYAIPFRRGDRVLATMAEYASNFIALLQLQRKYDLRIDLIPSDESGQASVKALEDMMDNSVRLVCVTHVPTSCGLVNPVEEIGRVVRQSRAFYLVDACQSVGQIPVDVREIGCHMLSTTSRKFLRGPRGVGFLYVSREILDQLEPPFLDLHAATWVSKDSYKIRPDARRFENWEANYAARIGFKTAMEYAMDWEIGRIWERVQHLGSLLRQKLSAIPGVQVRDLGRTRCGIVAFTVAGWNPVDVRNALYRKNMNVSVVNVESSRLDMEWQGVKSVVRASLHYYNTEAEIETFCEAVEQLAQKAGGIR